MLNIREIVDKFEDEYKGEISNLNVDCSEIAMWLYDSFIKAGLNAHIVSIRSTDNQHFKVKEFQREEEFIYHEIVTVYDYAIDIRRDKACQIQLYTDYKKELAELNKGKIFFFTEIV